MVKKTQTAGSFLYSFLICICLIKNSFAKEISVLSYDSFSGKGSMGEWIEKSFSQQCADCHVKFLKAGDLLGIVGRIKREQAQKDRAYSYVLGLDSLLYQQALKENLLEPGFVFERSPYSFIVDTGIYKGALPKSWKELVASDFKSHIFVQDPRTSDVGMGWLESIFDVELLSLADSRKLVKRVFPSWSTSYSAFTKSHEAYAVWTYLSSEAYHRCVEKTDRYRSLVLGEGYPVHEGWLAPLKGARRDSLEKRWEKWMLSNEVQSELPLKNWMFPATSKIKLPDCYSSLPIQKEARSQKSWDQKLKLLSQWLDQWALQ